MYITNHIYYASLLLVIYFLYNTYTYIDEKLVQDSKRITWIRNLIASKLYHDGKLTDRDVKRLGYDVIPPSPPTGEEVTGETCPKRIKKVLTVRALKKKSSNVSADVTV